MVVRFSHSLCGTELVREVGDAVRQTDRVASFASKLAHHRIGKIPHVQRYAENPCGTELVREAADDAVRQTDRVVAFANKFAPTVIAASGYFATASLRSNVPVLCGCTFKSATNGFSGFMVKVSNTPQTMMPMDTKKVMFQLPVWSIR
jgi:hypothetical protein